jgi:hypothetical protein
VHEERHHVHDEHRRPALFRGRDARKREREHRQGDRQRGDEPLQEQSGRHEGRREAVDEEREEHEELDVEPLRQVLECAVRVGRHEPAHGDEERDRREREREPPCCAGSMRDPESHRDDGEHGEADRVDDPDGDDERVHIPPGRVAAESYA